MRTILDQKDVGGVNVAMSVSILCRPQDTRGQPLGDNRGIVDGSLAPFYVPTVYLELLLQELLRLEFVEDEVCSLVKFFDHCEEIDQQRVDVWAKTLGGQVVDVEEVVRILMHFFKQLLTVRCSAPRVEFLQFILRNSRVGHRRIILCVVEVKRVETLVEDVIRRQRLYIGTPFAIIPGVTAD